MASNKLFKGIALGALALQLVAPALAFAEDGTSTDGGDRPTVTSAQFCSRLSTFGSKIDEGMYNRETKLKADRNERGTKMEDKWSKRDDELKANRAKRDENITAHFDKIESRNLTDVQKTAIEAFKTAYAAALSTRQAAIDAAIKTYRDGVASATSTHQASVDSLISAFRAAVKAAEDKAVTDCGAGVSMTTVRSTLIESIKSAKDTLQSGRKALDNRGDSIKSLVEARNASVKAAMDAFKTAIESARTTLKAAFPEIEK